MATPCQFTQMSQWTSRVLTCPIHGTVDNVIMFNDDVTDAYCLACWKADLLKNASIKKTTLSA